MYQNPETLKSEQNTELLPPFSTSLGRIYTTKEFYTPSLPEGTNSSSALSELKNIEKLKDTSLYLCTLEQWKMKIAPEKLSLGFLGENLTVISNKLLDMAVINPLLSGIQLTRKVYYLVLLQIYRMT